MSEKPLVEVKTLDLRRTCLSCFWVRTAWITGKPNLPSVKSSAKLLFSVYYSRMSSQINNDLCILPTNLYTHLFQTQIAIVVAYLKVQAQYSRQLRIVLLVGAEQLHKANGQHKEAASFAHSHQLVIRLGWTREAVAPIDLHALSTVQLQQLFGVHLGSLQETRITLSFIVEVDLRTSG